MVTSGGAVDIVRLADGVPVTPGRIAWDAGSPEEGTYADLFLDATRLYVGVNGPQSALTAHAVDTLRQVWRIDADTAVATYPCRRLMCGVEPEGIAAYDPSNGAVRWHNPGSAMRNRPAKAGCGPTATAAGC
jgi:hypothetical protein